MRRAEFSENALYRSGDIVKALLLRPFQKAAQLVFNGHFLGPGSWHRWRSSFCRMLEVSDVRKTLINRVARKLTFDN